MKKNTRAGARTPAETTPYALWSSLVEDHGKPPKNTPVSQGAWRYMKDGIGIHVGTKPAVGYDGEPNGEYEAWFGGTNEITVITESHPKWKDFHANIWPRLQAVSPDEYEVAIEESEWFDGVGISERAPDDYLLGGNSPPEASATEVLFIKIDDEVGKAEAIVEAGAARTSAQADRASTKIAALSSYRNQIETTRENEKKPHLDAGRAIDALYIPIRNKLDKKIDEIKNLVIRPYLLAEEAKREQEAKYARAEAARLAKQEALRSGAGIKAAKEEAEAAAEAVKAPEKARVGGGGGSRTVSMRTVTGAKVVDYYVLAKWMLDQDHPDLKNSLQTFANTFARNKIFPPGTEKVEFKKAV